MDVNTPPADTRDRRAARAAAALLAAVAAFCLTRGMPWPHPDDLPFVGAGIDLARTGQLACHGMDGWLARFGTPMFYIQLPFPTYSLALWLKVLGVGTATMLGFQWLWYAAGGWALVRTLGRFGLPLGLRLFLAALYLLFMVDLGMRPEPEAAALLFLGLTLVDTGASFARRAGALTLLGLACTSYPMVLALAAPFGAALAWLTLPAGEAAAARGPWCTLARAWVVPALVGAAVSILLIVAMVHGDVRAFLSVFEAHRRDRAATGRPLALYFASITQYHEALLSLPIQALLAAVAVGVAARWRRVEPGLRALVAACAVAAVGCILLYATKAAGWIGLLAFFAAGAAASMRGLRRWRWPLVLGLAAVYGASHCLGLLGLVARRAPDPAALRAARETVAASGKRLVTDYSAARYVFDYHFAPDTRFANYVRPRIGEEPWTLADTKRPDEAWVVTPYGMSLCYVDLPPAYQDYPRLRLGRHEFQSMPAAPDDPVVIP